MTDSQSRPPDLKGRPQEPNPELSRRGFLRAAGAAATLATLSADVAARIRGLGEPIRIGLIADLHHDLMHDGEARMDAFLQWTASTGADCVVQLGDFAYPSPKNRALIDGFNQAKGLHVIGNHDMDSGHTSEQCIDVWGMSGRYHARNVGGLQLLVLDGNDKGSPTHQGGYAAYIGRDQLEWLKEQLGSHDGPSLIFSHQALAGPWAVDNAAEVQALSGRHVAKIAMCVNGHSHIDLLQRIDKVYYLHVNSASYQWVGGAHEHESYAAEVHAAQPWIGHTCPYRDPVFAALRLDPDTGTMLIEGRDSAWVGPSPAAIGADLHPDLTNGEEIAPRIRSGRVERVRT